MLRRLFIRGAQALLFCCFLTALATFSAVATVRYLWTTSRVTLPDLAGQKLDYALNILTESHLTLKEVQRQVDPRIPKDYIIAQNPPTGTKLKRKGIVQVVVSQGIETATIPNLIGKSWRDTTRILARQRFRIGKVAYAHAADVPIDTIITQTPLPDAEAEIGMTVDVLVSRGPYKTVMVMPDLVETQLAYARDVIDTLGLNLHKIEHEAYPVPPNTIISQTPKPGTLIEERNMVSLVVSTDGRTREQVEAARVEPTYQTFEYTVPPGPFEHDIAMVVRNRNGLTEVYHQFMKPGYRIPVDIPVLGETLVEVYVDGILDSIQRMN